LKPFVNQTTSYPFLRIPYLTVPLCGALGQSVGKLRSRSKSNKRCPFKLALERQSSKKTSGLKMSKSFMCIANRKHQLMNPKKTKPSILVKGKVGIKTLKGEKKNNVLKNNLRKVLQKKQSTKISKKPLKFTNNCIKQDNT